jgi:hypothetical protein
MSLYNTRMAVNCRTVTFVTLVGRGSILATNTDITQVCPTVVLCKLMDVGITKWKPVLVDVLNMIQ